MRFKDKNLTKTDRERGTKTPKLNICILCSRAVQNAKCNPIFSSKLLLLCNNSKKKVYFMLKNNCDFCEDDDASEEESIYLIILNDNQIHVCILIFFCDRCAPFWIVLKRTTKGRRTIALQI